MYDLENATNAELAELALGIARDIDRLQYWHPTLAEIARRLKVELPEPSRASHFS